MLLGDGAAASDITQARAQWAGYGAAQQQFQLLL